MNPILTVMPSRGRPHECKKALDSFLATSSQSDISILIDENDPTLSLYREFDPFHKYLVPSPQNTITHKMNAIVRLNPPYKYYHITNDDVVYHTDGWDKIFMHLLELYGGGIIYGNDLFQQSNLPTFPFISGEIVNKLGWIQMPNLNRYCGDLIWKVLADNARCLYYLGHVIIEHNHYLAGKSHYPVDMEIYKQDQLVFAQWMRSHHEDVEKILEVLNVGKSLR